ncbi:AEC family transporter [Orbus wheelerorum]|uniref:AEC family transporter n=1 Tax=Orbus wheelerorum TaxID=3074111 RepID=UPI00370D0337
MDFLTTLWLQFLATLPLFILILLGFLLVKIFKWPKTITDGLTKFTFALAIPIMLFHIMSHFSEQPKADYRVLLAFFGGTLLVFIISRIIAAKIFKLDGATATMFSMGGIYSNNVFVGLPIIKALLGDKAVPSVALVVVFSALILWTLATISIEFAQVGKLSTIQIKKAVKNIFKNPVILGIFAGLIVNYIGIPLPNFISQSTKMVGDMAAPLSLIVLGMGIAEYKISEGWRLSSTICLLKLAILPFVIYWLAVLLNLPTLETYVVVLLGSMSIAINCYIMSRQFNLLQATIASSLLISTVLSSIVTPLILAILTHI